MVTMQGRMTIRRNAAATSKSCMGLAFSRSAGIEACLTRLRIVHAGLRKYSTKALWHGTSVWSDPPFGGVWLLTVFEFLFWVWPGVHGGTPCDLGGRKGRVSPTPPPDVTSSFQVVYGVLAVQSIHNRRLTSKIFYPLELWAQENPPGEGRVLRVLIWFKSSRLDGVNMPTIFRS